ncbi:MAG: site-2 protease family protein [Kiritimatiellae bacterium]|nr:site-2 protease family protein [Kiritimatiellia bacterium]
MLKTKFYICEMFGVPIYVDISFAILLLLFINSQESFMYGVTSALLLAISVIAHEFGHSLTARAFGCHTRDITISLLGGCAAIIALPRKAWQEFLTALAGPLVSFALSASGFAAGFLLPVESDWLFFVFMYLAWMNLILGAFNLLPGFPMDGGRIFRSVLQAFLSRPKATYVAMVVGRVFAVLLGLSGLHAVFTGGGWGFVRILIAWMIWREGYREYQLALMESSWRYDDFRAKVSPPPYGGDGDDCDVTRGG